MCGAAGGDGFGAFGEAVKASKGYAVVGGALKGEALVFADPGRWLRDLFVAHLRRVGTDGPSGEGRFPQVSGLRFTWSRAAPAGARVREVWVGDGALVPERSYVVATNDFLAAGGDGFGAFGDAVKASKGFAVVGGALKGEALVFSDPGHWVRDLFVARLRGVGTVAPSVEGRIREVE